MITIQRVQAKTKLCIGKAITIQIDAYMKIKQIAEDLRAMGIRNNWLIVTATQINRNGYNSSDISMTDVAESAGLYRFRSLIMCSHPSLLFLTFSLDCFATRAACAFCTLEAFLSRSTCCHLQLYT